MKKVFLLLILMSFGLISCALPAKMTQTPAEKTGRLLLYLQPLPQEASSLTFTVAGLAARREDGSEIHLHGAFPPCTGASLIGVQTRLLSISLPPGRYSGLVMTLGSASARRQSGVKVLQVSPKPIFLAKSFTMARRKNVTLFLSLSAERLMTDGSRFTPSFLLSIPQRQLIDLKGFVSNSASDSLTVINKRLPEVVANLAVGASPEGMALDQARGWLYVALKDEDAVAMVEVSNSLTMGKIQLHYGDGPTELALSPDGRILVAINPGSNTASIINTSSLSEVSRIKFTSEPCDVVMGREGTLAYVLFANTNSIAVLDLTTPERVTVRSATLPESPRRGVLSRDGKSLYLVTGIGPDLLVVDTSTLAVTGRIFAGGSSLCLAVDRTSGLLYLGGKSGEIAVVDPTMGVLIDTFAASGPVVFLTIDYEENSLFAVLPEQQTVEKIDLVSKRLLGTVAVDDGAHAMVVVGE